MSIVRKVKNGFLPAMAVALGLSAASVTAVQATDWVYYSPQSSPQYITPRGAELFVEKARRIGSRIPFKNLIGLRLPRLPASAT